MESKPKANPQWWEFWCMQSLTHCSKYLYDDGKEEAVCACKEKEKEST